MSVVFEGWITWMLKFSLVLVFIWLSRNPEEPPDNQDGTRIQIVVLGDIGRSPRMQYHALSIAKHGGQVDIIGYEESTLHHRIRAATNIDIHALTPFPGFLRTNNRWLFLALGPLKVLFQVWTLWTILQLKTKRPGWMLIQNPPSIPTLFVALVVCRLRKSRLVIDWHNFGFSILALRLGKSHPLVWLSALYEQSFARFADAHFCVTNAMARVLEENYNIYGLIYPLHDRPTALFRVLDESQRLLFLDELSAILLHQGSIRRAEAQEFEHGRKITGRLETDSTGTMELVTAIKSGTMKLVVSSTSWTPDEDFSTLLHALAGYSERAQDAAATSLPQLLVIVTGKGPHKAEFEAQVAVLNRKGRLSHATIKTGFFDDIDDYARLLGSADLGVSLHTSSSGVDLPMKVVDMFGAGLPVAGWGDFEAWPELVKEGINGKSFKSTTELQEILCLVFGPDQRVLRRLKKGAVEEGKRRWDDEWDPIAGKLFGFVIDKPHRQ